MDDIHDIIELIHRCAFCSRLPRRAELLATKLQELSPESKRRALNEMKSVDLVDRMARRAAQLAGCRLSHAQQASSRIANAMCQIFGKGHANYCLKRAGWREPIRSTLRDPRLPIPQEEWQRPRLGFAV